MQHELKTRDALRLSGEGEEGVLERDFRSKMADYNEFQTVFEPPMNIQMEKSNRQLKIDIINTL